MARTRRNTHQSSARRPGQPGPDEAKITVIINKDLAKKLKLRALEEESSAKAILVRALEAHLGG